MFTLKPKELKFGTVSSAENQAHVYSGLDFFTFGSEGDGVAF